MEKSLYVGVDDSNNGKYPEILVAVFSTIEEDLFLKNFSRHRDFGLLSRFQSPNRDYRFTILGKEQIPPKDKISLVLPNLILPYLEQKEHFDKMIISIDGKLDKVDKNKLKQNLSDKVGYINSMGFIKSMQTSKENKKIKFYRQPFIVGLADVKANELFSQHSLSGLLSDLKYIPFKT